jgi:hypothetical protein
LYTSTGLVHFDVAASTTWPGLLNVPRQIGTASADVNDLLGFDFDDTSKLSIIFS